MGDVCIKRSNTWITTEDLSPCLQKLNMTRLSFVPSHCSIPAACNDSTRTISIHPMCTTDARRLLDLLGPGPKPKRQRPGTSIQNPDCTRHSLTSRASALNFTIVAGCNPPYPTHPTHQRIRKSAAFLNASLTNSGALSSIPSKTTTIALSPIRNSHGAAILRR